MTGDRAADLVWACGALVLVGSALAARRLPAKRLGLMALAWIAIFIAALALVVLCRMLVHRDVVVPERPATPLEMTNNLHNVYYRTDG